MKNWINVGGDLDLTWANEQNMSKIGIKSGSLGFLTGSDMIQSFGWACLIKVINPQEAFQQLESLFKLYIKFKHVS